MPYLLKTEPSTYSFADLQRERTTQWDGVKNPFALRNLAAMKPGDELIIYHTGDEKSAIGTARVEAVDAGDPRDPKVKITAGKALAPEMRFSIHFSGEVHPLAVGAPRGRRTKAGRRSHLPAPGRAVERH